MKEYVTFIILHYNCYRETRECIDSILDLKEKENIKIVVMDNASTNDSLQKLQKQYGENSQIYLLHNEENLGFSRGNNMAYEYAKQHWNSEFVIVANNDILFPEKDFVGKIRKEYENSKFGVLSPDIYHVRLGIHQSPISEQMILPVGSVRKTIFLNSVAVSLFPLFYRFFRKTVQDSVYESTDLSYRKDIVPMGACLIFSRMLLEKKEKLFSPETFFYYEEYILSCWCKKNNVDIVFQPEIQVLHNHGVSTESIGTSREVMRFRMKNILDAAKVYYKMLHAKGGNV
jgi:GT2 family glycosyltransferase